MIGFHRLHTVHSTQKMPKNKVLSLNQKAQICEASLAPGFDKEHCIKRFEISRSCLNRILRNKDQFMTFYDSNMKLWEFKKKMTIQTIKQQSQSFLSECAICELCHAALIYNTLWKKLPTD